jgi:hypothetical protein
MQNKKAANETADEPLIDVSGTRSRRHSAKSRQTGLTGMAIPHSFTRLSGS